MCFGSSMPAPPPPPPAPPPPFKRAGMVEPATANRGISKRKRGTSQLTSRRPTTGGIQSGQSGVSTNQY